MKRSTSHRREFLTGAAAARALNRAVEQVTLPAEDVAGEDRYLVQVSRRAMACEFQVTFDSRRHPAGTKAALAALAEVDRLEDVLSVFRQASDISRLNREAAGAWTPVDRDLYRVLSRSIELSRCTGGAFDVTSAPLTRAWGFLNRQGAVPDPHQLARARQLVGYEGIELDEATSSVRFTRQGMEINLGAVGKGYALDACASIMEAAGVSDFLWHAGQSSVLARGSSGPGRTGWLVGVPHPLRPAERLALVELENQALATSGSQVQFFREGGRRYGHIIDPRSGQPAEGVLATTVLAENAADSDALATAFYVMGNQSTAALCEQLPGVRTLFVLHEEGRGIRVEAIPADWQGWTPVAAG